MRIHSSADRDNGTYRDVPIGTCPVLSRPSHGTGRDNGVTCPAVSRMSHAGLSAELSASQHDRTRGPLASMACTKASTIFENSAASLRLRSPKEYAVWVPTFQLSDPRRKFEFHSQGCDRSPAELCARLENAESCLMEIAKTMKSREK
jgi:hypothetical protein